MPLPLPDPVDPTLGPPCAWTPLDGVCTTTFDAGIWDTAVTIATSLLWAMSGRRYGQCPTTIRPCAARMITPPANAPAPTVGGASSSPWLGLNGARPLPSCGCDSSCDCTGLASVDLPGPAGPISDITVLLDGATFTDFTLITSPHGRPRLLRTDGQAWPAINDLTKPDSQPGTWSVTFLLGTPVPVGGRYAAAVYACEIAKALSADDSCRLPMRAQQIAREGITVNLYPQDWIDNGLTGLPDVDTWLRTVNPAQQHSPSMVFSPDLDTYAQR